MFLPHNLALETFDKAFKCRVTLSSCGPWPRDCTYLSDRILDVIATPFKFIARASTAKESFRKTDWPSNAVMFAISKQLLPLQLLLVSLRHNLFNNLFPCSKTLGSTLWPMLAFRCNTIIKEASPRLSSKSSSKATRAQNSHFNLSTKGSFAGLTCCLKAFYSSPYSSPCNGARINTTAEL